MFRPEVDPLADAIPPRHAYESDEEDEFPAPPSVTHLQSSVDVKIVAADKQENGSLIIATGEVAAVWARGASLGEQVGQIMVQATTIGLVFQPSWTASSVIISEPFSKLPAWAMHEYAQAVLDYWKPSRLVIADSYSTPTYITPEPIPHHLAPIRYLKTGKERYQRQRSPTRGVDFTGCDHSSASETHIPLLPLGVKGTVTSELPWDTCRFRPAITFVQFSSYTVQGVEVNLRQPKRKTHASDSGLKTEFPQ